MGTRYLKIAIAVALLTSSAYATIDLKTTSRAGGPTGGAAGDAISGRSPLPIVLDCGSGTTSTHSTGSAEQIGIRFAEKKLTTCSYTHATLTLTCTDAFTTLSWELNTASTNGATDWTASAGDLLAYYHDGGTELHGKPIGVRIAGSDAVEGTCGSLADGQWCWGDSDTIGSNRLYVQLTAPATDPDLEATGHVKVLYGDGEYIEVQHADFNSGNPVFVYVDTKVSDDAITLATAPTGASADETNVTVFQAVNPWTDLRFNYSVSCPNGGGNCIEDITNGDQRPGLTTTAIDETVGRGPIWAFVFKEGFGADAVITITANDDANGDTQDSQTIAVDEEPWAGGAAIRYVASTGDDSDGTTLPKAWQQPEDCINWLRTASAGSECVLLAGDTTTAVASPTTWSNIAGERRIRSSVAGTKATVTVPTTIKFFASSGTTGTGLSIMDIDINKSGTAGPLDINTSQLAVVRVDVNSAGGAACMSLGQTSMTAIDTVVWDSTFTTNTTSAGVYPMFSPHDGSSGAADSCKRRAWVGNHFDFKGGEHTFRAWPYVMLLAYNEFEHDGTPSAAKDNLKLVTGSDSGNDFESRYASIRDNYIYVTGTNTTIQIFQIGLDHDTGNNVGFRDYLIEGNFIENRSTSTTLNHTGVMLRTVRNLVARNNVFVGHKRSFEASTPGTLGNQPIRIFSNSFYINKASDIFILKGGGSNEDIANLKFINNAVLDLASTSSSNYEIQNTGSTGTLESTQILHTFTEWGSASAQFRVEGANTNADTWDDAAGKAAQPNYGTLGTGVSPLFALPSSNDFRLCTAAGTPDASCAGASPCIDAGYDLPTVYYDYSGAVRNSDDIGAWDDDSNGAGPPVAGDGANDMMLMGVAR